MKNIHTKEEFLLIKEENVNEGLFSFLKGIFKSIGKLYDKIKGGKELKKAIENYKEKIDKVFIGLTSAEQSKTASNKNVNATIESVINEENAEESTEETTAQQTGQELQPTAQDLQNDENANLDSTQLKGKINVSKDHIKQIKKAFDNEVNSLVKRFTGKDGKVPKKLEYSLSLAKNQITDYIFGKWEKHYTQIGDKKTISNIQKQRAQVAKEMEVSTQALQQLIEGGDKEQIKFEVDKKYKYTSSEGKISTITVKEVSEDGSEVMKAVTRKGVEINPYSDKVSNYYEKGQKYEYKNSNNKNITVEVIDIADDTGAIQVKYVGPDNKVSTFAVGDNTKLGYKVEPQTQPQTQTQAQPKAQTQTQKSQA